MDKIIAEVLEAAARDDRAALFSYRRSSLR
jgi:hypothetical protein